MNNALRYHTFCQIKLPGLQPRYWLEITLPVLQKQYWLESTGKSYIPGNYMLTCSVGISVFILWRSCKFIRPVDFIVYKCNVFYNETWELGKIMSLLMQVDIHNVNFTNHICIYIERDYVMDDSDISNIFTRSSNIWLIHSFACSLVRFS